MSCPICNKSTHPTYRPFCSKRCADVDLAHWLRGSYAVPAEQTLLPEDDADNDMPTPAKPH